MVPNIASSSACPHLERAALVDLTETQTPTASQQLQQLETCRRMMLAHGFAVSPHASPHLSCWDCLVAPCKHHQQLAANSHHDEQVAT